MGKVINDYVPPIENTRESLKLPMAALEALTSQFVLYAAFEGILKPSRKKYRGYPFVKLNLSRVTTHETIVQEHTMQKHVTDKDDIVEE